MMTNLHLSYRDFCGIITANQKAGELHLEHQISVRFFQDAAQRYENRAA